MRKPNKFTVENAVKKINALNIENSSVAEIQSIINQLLNGYQLQAATYDSGVIIYRGRICEKPTHFSEIIYPQPQFVKKYGRANDLNKSIFYGSIGRIAPYAEIGAKVGDTLVMSKWISRKELILNHVGFTSETTQKLNSKRALENLYKFVEGTNNFSDLNKFVYNYLASKFTLEVNDLENYKYKISVAITNILLGKQFDGIMYPSLASKGASENIVLKPEYVDENLKLVSVEYIQITENNEIGYEWDVIDAATEIGDRGEILWTGRNLVIQSRSLEVENGEWIARDENGEFIFPTATGSLLNVEPILKLYNNYKGGDIFRCTKEAVIQQGDISFRVGFSLDVRIDRKEKYLSIYIPNCPDPMHFLKDFISNFWDVTNAFPEVFERKDSFGNTSFTSENHKFIQRVEVYSEQKLDISSIKDEFNNFEINLHMPT